MLKVQFTDLIRKELTKIIVRTEENKKMEKIESLMQKFFLKLCDEYMTDSDLLDITKKLDFLLMLKIKEEAIENLKMIQKEQEGI